MRTFADVVGVPAPARADGVSLLPELTGQGTQQDRGYLYVEYFNDGKTPGYVDFTPNNRGRLRNQMQAIRIGDYVGLRYDIKSQADPFQEIYKVCHRGPQGSHQSRARHDRTPRADENLGAPGARRPDSDAPRPYDNELVPAVQASSVTNGVNWQAFEGVYPWSCLISPKHYPLWLSGTASQPDLQKRTRNNDIGMLFTGYLNVPQDGNYMFYLTADTGALLRIHDATVIDADYGYRRLEPSASGSICLQAGLHPFRLYWCAPGPRQADAEFFVEWSGYYEGNCPRQRISVSSRHTVAAAITWLPWSWVSEPGGKISRKHWRIGIFQDCKTSMPFSGRQGCRPLHQAGRPDATRCPKNRCASVSIRR